VRAGKNWLNWSDLMFYNKLKLLRCFMLVWTNVLSVCAGGKGEGKVTVVARRQTKDGMRLCCGDFSRDGRTKTTHATVPRANVEA